MANRALILGQQFFVARVDRVTLTLRMAKLVFRDIHDEPGNWSDCHIGALARARLVLAFLVIGLPA